MFAIKNKNISSSGPKYEEKNKTVSNKRKTLSSYESESEDEIDNDNGKTSRCYKSDQAYKLKSNHAQSKYIEKYIKKTIKDRSKQNSSKISKSVQGLKKGLKDVTIDQQTKSNEIDGHSQEKTIKVKETKNVSSVKARISDLTEDSLILLFQLLNNNDKFNFILSEVIPLNIIGGSNSILKQFTLKVDSTFLKIKQTNPEVISIRFKNVELNLEQTSELSKVKNVFKELKDSVENLKVLNAKFEFYKQFNDLVGNIPTIKTLIFEKCHIDCIDKETLPSIKSLKSISFNKCNDNMFKVFSRQTSISKITITNEDWTWKGFYHEFFNKIAEKNKNLNEIKLVGAGTGSFFDSDEFKFKVRKLDTSMITFHWYVGIKTERTSFLKSQLGYLKDLTIHQLPNDFDGGRVLKYILNEMNLETFYYGKTPLILKGKKQDVKEFEASEIQIQSAFEMMRQFPSIRTFRLTISATDIASDEIEKIINPSVDLFKNIKKFEVIDNSKYRGILGVFLCLFKNMTDLECLSFITQDRNINVLLEESLTHMTKLNEIYLTSATPRSAERFRIIKQLVPELRKLSIASQFLNEARDYFDKNVEICEVCKSN